MSSHIFHNLASYTEWVGKSGERGLKCEEEAEGAQECWAGVSFPGRQQLM